MTLTLLVAPFRIVALRKESVDRNIQTNNTPEKKKIVALRKESVDRNIKADVSYNIEESRSPQGERG